MRKYISIKWKFLGICLILLTLPTAVLGVFLYQTYYREALANARKDLALIAKGWQIAADVYYEEQQRILKREQVLVEKRLASIALDAKRMLDLDAVSGGAGQPNLRAALDKLAEIRIGRSGYVFVLDRDGKYLLSRNHMYDGLSLLELPQQEPPETYRRILERAAKIRGDDVEIFQYSWKDALDEAPRVKIVAMARSEKTHFLIAASAYLTDFKSYELERLLAEELKDRMAAQRIGERGYVFALGHDGRALVTKDRLRDGENLFDYQDEKGVHIFRELLRRAELLQNGEAFITTYNWKDLDDKTPQRRLTAVVHAPGWEWVIGASAYEGDFLKGLSAIRWHVLRICLGFLALGTLLALFFAEHVSRPIRQLEGIAARGDLNAVMDARILASRDEIGSLGLAFDGMMKNLREKINELEVSRLELMKKNEELQRTQRQLVQSEKLAAIGQLAAGIAHEINNPLAYVMSNLETLEGYIDAYESVLRHIDEIDQRQAAWATGEDARTDLQKYWMEARSERMVQVRQDIRSIVTDLLGGLTRVKRIVMDLRVFARAEHEEMAEVNIESILEQVITIVAPQVRGKAEIVRDYGKLPKIKCQVHRLSQVFINILINAAHAISKQKGIIGLRTYVQDNWICVDVTDNGEGIREEHLPRIFEPFFTTKAVGQGTGLGLSISYEIIKKHGGDIRVSSAPGQTTFTVLLPMGGPAKAL